MRPMHPNAQAPALGADLTCDVLVVGAGPAGSATAAALARSGRDVLLIDARRHPRPKTCAEYASPRIAEELETLGLADDAWRANARPLSGMRVILEDLALDVRYADASGPRTAWGLERSTFDATLAGHAVRRGARLLEPASFDGLVGRDGVVHGAAVRVDGQVAVVRARWLIGADGARSRVARRLGVERPVRRPRRLGLVAHYTDVAALDGHGEMHVGPGWYVGLAPLTGARVNVGMALPMDPAPRPTARAAIERFAAAVDGLPGVAERLRHARRVSPIHGAAPIGHRVAAVSGPGWMLVGDAAGFIDPFTGEGIHRALRSARAAAAALHDLDLGAAERYRLARRRAFAAKDALTWLIQGMLAAPPLMRYALRRLAARPDAAAVLGAALGDCRPASDALSPRLLVEVLRP